MTEKRSARQRKVQSYSLLADESDDEFFYDDDDDEQPVKHKKYDSDDFTEEKPASKSSKTKKKTVKEKVPTKKPSETTTPVPKENQPPPPPKTNNETKLTNNTSVTVSHSETPKSPVTNMTPKFLSKSVPTTPVHHSTVPLSNVTVTPPPSSLGKASFPVTPSSGLRLGLSRTKKLRPLHTNVRIT